MHGSTLWFTSSCTSTTHCRLSGRATRNTSGGRSTWQPCRLYVFALVPYTGFVWTRVKVKWTRALREQKLRWDQNLIKDSNPDFEINPDPVVCGLLPKCIGFTLLSVWVILQNIIKISRWLTVWDILINLLNSPIQQSRERNGKVVQKPYLGPDHHQKLVGFSVSRCPCLVAQFISLLNFYVVSECC